MMLYYKNTGDAVDGILFSTPFASVGHTSGLTGSVRYVLAIFVRQRKVTLTRGIYSHDVQTKINHYLFFTHHRAKFCKTPKLARVFTPDPIELACARSPWSRCAYIYSRTQADQAIETPLYFSLDRERLLGEVSMPTNEPQDVWILAGVALFLKD